MSKNDEQIAQLLEKIEIKSDNLGKKPKGNWLTNCTFKYDDGDYVNLHTVNSLEICVALASELLNKQSLVDAAIEALELEYDDYDNFTWNGFGFEDWIEDLKLRASMIKWDKENKKLNKLDKKLKDLRSEDAKTEDALSDIADLL